MNKKHFLYSLPMILLLIVAVAGWFATDYLGNKARQEIISESQAAVLTLSTYVSSTFINIEGAAKSLAGSPWIASALLSKREQDIEHANSALDRYNSAINASVSYLMNADGMTVASSNRKDPDSFVGKSYRFRPYFQEAAKGQPDRYFALGITSGNRGFYASYPVQNRLGKVLGVVTMKKDIDDMGTFFRKYPFCFLISPDGIIFLASKPAMVLKSLWPLDKAAQEKLLASQQFGKKPFEPVFLKKEIADGTEVTLEEKDYFVSRKVIDSDGWSLVFLTPTDRIRAYKLIGILATIGVGILIMVFSGIIYVTDRSKVAIRQSENKYRILADNINDVIFVLDMNLKYTYISPSVKILRGYEPEEALQQSPVETMTPSSRDLVIRTLSEVMELEKSEQRDISISRTLQLEVRRKDGTTVWTEMKFSFIRDEDQRPVGIMGVTRDITKRRQTEVALRENRTRLEDIVAFLPDATLAIDKEKRIIIWNKAIEGMTGVPAAEMIGKGDYTYSIPFYGEARPQLMDLVFLDHKEIAAQYPTITREGDSLTAEAFCNALYNNKGAWIFGKASPLHDQFGNIIGAIESIRDITEHKQVEEKIQQMAYHDSLTGLPNRKLFSDRLGIALAQAQRNQQKVGVAMLDLDKFKDVNDTLGHDVGDLLLQAAAERLSAALRKGDTVARFGGDEFVLILPDLEVIEGAIQVAQKIVDSFRKPFLIDTQQLVVTTSIGIAVYPGDGIDEGTLLKNADIAMYLAKQAGRVRYQLYKEAVNSDK